MPKRMEEAEQNGFSKQEQKEINLSQPGKETGQYEKDDSQAEWDPPQVHSKDVLAGNVHKSKRSSERNSTCEPDVIMASPSTINDDSQRIRTESTYEPDIFETNKNKKSTNWEDDWSPESLAISDDEEENNGLKYITLEHVFELVQDSSTTQPELLQILENNPDITSILKKRNTRAYVSNIMEALLLRNWLLVHEHILSFSNDLIPLLNHRELEIALLSDECLLASSILDTLTVNYLLSLMSVNTRLNSGNTLLHFAAMFSKDDIFCELLRKGGSAMIVNNNGNTPLHYACMFCSIDTIQEALLVTKYCSYQNCNGETPLHCMIKSQNFGQISYELLSKFDLRCRDRDGDTVLHLAAKGNSELPVRLLTVDTRTPSCMLLKNKNGDTFLDLLIKRCYQQPVGSFCNSFELLLQKRESLPWVPKTEDVRIILVKVLSPEPSNERFLISLVKHPKITVILFRKKEDGSSIFETLISKCLAKPHPSICYVLKALIECRPRSDYWFENNQGVVKIILDALMDENKPLFTCFISHPHCDLSVKLNRNNDTIIHIVSAMKTIKSDSIELLFSHPLADLDITNSHGDTPIHVACRHGNFELVSKMASCKTANLNLMNLKGYTPLMEVLKRHKDHGNIDTLNILSGIFKEVYPGDNLLHVASRMNYSLQFALDILTPAKGSVLMKSYNSLNEKGHTPLYIALATQQFDKAEILLSAYNPHGYSLLQHACLSPDLIDTLSALLKIPKHCESLHLTDRKGNTPLHVAITSQNLPTAIELLINADKKQALIRNQSGETPLHIACHSKHTQVIDILLKACPEAVTIKDDDDYLPLHSACQLGDKHTVEKLLKLDSNPEISLSMKNSDGDTPIHLISKESASLLKYVLNEYKLQDVFTITDKQGNTPFHLVLRLHSNQEVVIALKAIFKHVQQVPMIYNKSGSTVYHECIKEPYDDPLKIILENITNRLTCKDIAELSCSAIQTDPPSISKINILLNYHKHDHSDSSNCEAIASSRDGNSLLHYVAMINCVSLASRVINEFGANPSCVGLHGNTPLHTACLYQNQDVARFLLSTTKCDIDILNSFNQSPLELIKDSVPMLSLFDSFQKLSSCVDQYSIDSYCKVFVTGHSGAGKTTIIEVFKNFVRSKGAVTKFMFKFQKNSQVEKLTAGIIPSVFSGEGVGNLIIYDLAGHFEYHSSHSAILEHLISSSCPLFVLLVNLSKTYVEVESQLNYWLNLLQTESSQLKSISPVIVIGSHDDEASSRPRYADKKSLVTTIFSQGTYPSLRLASFIQMDCRKKASSGLETLQKIAVSECRQLRQLAPKVSIICHGLYAYLTNITDTLTQDDLALTLGDLQKHLQDSETDFLPTDCGKLSEHLETLSDKGLVMFLPNSCEVTKSWIIVQKEALLSQINGRIFAPKHFTSHVKTISNTGLVSKVYLEECFPQYPVDILVTFLTHFELCEEFDSNDFINSELLDENQETLPDRLLFFPALIQEGSLGDYWPPDGTSGQGYYWFSWVMESNTQQFFTLRFLHVLLLRLAFTFAFRPSKHDLAASSGDQSTSDSTDNPSIKRRCSIWKTGIRWLTDNTGIWTMVHLTNNNRTLQMLMASPKNDYFSTNNYLPTVIYRTKVMKTILDTKDKYCKELEVREVFRHPSRALLPLDENFSLPSSGSSHLNYIYSLTDVRRALLEKQEPNSTCRIVDMLRTKPTLLEDLLLFDIYRGFSQEVLDELFKISNQDEQVTEDFVVKCVESLKCARAIMDPNTFGTLIFSISERRVEESLYPNQSKYNQYCAILRLWIEEAPRPTYKELHLCFDKLSIFAGRNPKVTTTDE